MLKFRSSLARWWLKYVSRCTRPRNPGLALRSRSLSVPTGGPLRFPRGRCLFPLVDLCNSLAFAFCSRWRTFALPSRSLPVPTGGPSVAVCCSHWRTCFCVCATLWSTPPEQQVRYVHISCYHVITFPDTMAMGIRILFFSSLVISKNWVNFPTKLAKLVQFISLEKKFFSNFFPISFVKKTKNHWMASAQCPHPHSLSFSHHVSDSVPITKKTNFP